MAEDTSDLQTEEESLSERKRKVRRPLKFDSSDDDSESALPRPPKLLKTKSDNLIHLSSSSVKFFKIQYIFRFPIETYNILEYIT